MLVVFDWDGTLIDSSDKIVLAMQRAAQSLQLEVLSSSSINQIIGLGLPEAIHTLYPMASDEHKLGLKQAYSQAFIELDRQLACRLFDGVIECFDRLDSLGIAKAVATGKSRKGLNRMLDNFDWHGRFVASKCADETASKPNPLMLEQLMQECGVSKSELVMIGDTSFDLEMARNAGVRSVGVSYGAHEVSVLEEFEPIAIVDDLSFLPDVLGLQ